MEKWQNASTKRDLSPWLSKLLKISKGVLFQSCNTFTLANSRVSTHFFFHRYRDAAKLEINVLEKLEMKISHNWLLNQSVHERYRPRLCMRDERPPAPQYRRTVYKTFVLALL